MSTPRFSLIFVNFQSSHQLEQALLSWQQATHGVATEYIVVNNDSTEENEVDHIVREQQARVIHLGSNFGFGKACNEGARLARGSFLFFLNPDTRYASGSLASLEAVFVAHPRSIGGIRLITPGSVEEPWSAGRFPSFWRLLWKQLFGKPWHPVWQARQFRHADWVSGAALALPKSLFDELGGFDEQYFLYFEDVDLCRRAVDRGATVWRFPFLTAIHQGGASHASRSVQKDYYYASQRRYFERYRPHWEAVLVRLFQRIRQLVVN